MAKNIKAAGKESKITRAILRKLPDLGRNALKELHLMVSGEKVFGLREEILEKTREAVCEYLGIDVE